MSAPEFTLTQAHDLRVQITRDDHEIAQPLFYLLRGVVDPNGDKGKFAIADDVMRQLILMTPEFEEWYRKQLTA